LSQLIEYNVSRLFRCAPSGFLGAALVVFASAPSLGQSPDYLTTAEVIAIGAGSAGVGLLGSHIKSGQDSTRTPLIRGPLPLDRTMERLIAGSNPGPGQTNFLDNTFGSIVTPAVTSGLLFIANLTWPQGESGKDALQDLYLGTMGLLGNKGVNDAVKGWVGRPRPYTQVEAESDFLRPHSTPSYDRSSMYSGHASSAFFITGYADKRFRSIMRSRMTGSEYDNWKWAPSVLLYGWASFVALSRVHALKHYFSDVVVGSIAGILFSELYYAFGKTTNENASGNPPVMMRVSFSFN
jgi:membrane-associated phospholipid phosphatase